jgi:hypothetical protein
VVASLVVVAALLAVAVVASLVVVAALLAVAVVAPLVVVAALLAAAVVALLVVVAALLAAAVRVVTATIVNQKAQCSRGCPISAVVGRYGAADPVFALVLASDPQRRSNPPCGSRGISAHVVSSGMIL